MQSDGGFVGAQVVLDTVGVLHSHPSHADERLEDATVVIGFHPPGLVELVTVVVDRVQRFLNDVIESERIPGVVVFLTTHCDAEGRSDDGEPISRIDVSIQAFLANEVVLVDVVLVQLNNQPWSSPGSM